MLIVLSVFRAFKRQIRWVCS